MIERTHLQILSQIERRGSLTAAAKALHLTQSALSHAIKRLEQEYETDIWQREGRGVRLTPAGAHLLLLAQRVLPQFEHAEQMLAQFAAGERGLLRIGMECHPCYQWLLKIVAPYLEKFPDVDLDVKQKFQFGGIGALFGHEIDMLITPDPLKRRDLHYEAVFPYEQVLVVGHAHPFASRSFITPGDLAHETLITYPVELERLDVFSQFLLPAGVAPKRHKFIETTDIMLQMVACGRGVAALPGWLVSDYKRTFNIKKVRLGRAGIKKHIHVGVRREDVGIKYISAFIDLARTSQGKRGSKRVTKRGAGAPRSA